MMAKVSFLFSLMSRRFDHNNWRVGAAAASRQCAAAPAALVSNTSNKDQLFYWFTARCTHTHTHTHTHAHSLSRLHTFTPTHSFSLTHTRTYTHVHAHTLSLSPRLSQFHIRSLSKRTRSASIFPSLLEGQDAMVRGISKVDKYRQI